MATSDQSPAPHFPLSLVLPLSPAPPPQLLFSLPSETIASSVTPRPISPISPQIYTNFDDVVTNRWDDIYMTHGGGQQQSSPFNTGNCPFCKISNMSFYLYKIHCNLEHPRSKYINVVSFWNEYNRALFARDNQLPSPLPQTMVSKPSVSISSQSTTTSVIPPKIGTIAKTPEIPKNNETIIESSASYSYEPSKSIRARKNIFISREYTSKMKSKIIDNFKNVKCYFDHNINKCKCDGLYLWMDYVIAMQFNDPATTINDNIKVFNCDFVDKETGENIYAVIERIECKQNDTSKVKSKYPWQMKNKLYTKSGIAHDFIVKDLNLPKSVCIQKKFITQRKNGIKIKLYLQENVDVLINDTKWCDVQIHSNTNNRRRKSLLMTKNEFTKDLMTMNNAKNINLVPILMFKNEEYEIHYLWIVQIDVINIGIAMIYDDRDKRVKVRGLHIDKKMICKQHQWIDLNHLDDCHCLNDFCDSSIDHLEIGPPDGDKNRYNQIKKRFDKLKATLQAEYDR